MDLTKNLEKYAELVLKKGVNIQEGQELLLNAPLVGRDFVRALVKQAYKLKSGHVHVFWNDEELSPIMFEHATDEVISTYPQWRREAMLTLAKKGAALLSVVASNPELLKNSDPKRVAKSQAVGAAATREFSEYVMTGKLNWNVVCVPSVPWAEKVFPNLKGEDAVNKLWEYIFKCTRVDQSDPIKAWEKHVDNLFIYRDFLNKKQFVTLKYKATGTDLTVGLPKGHIWVAGPKDTQSGITFIPNMPTEEVFTMNDKLKVDGTLASTMPLNYGGALIEGFSFEFKDGKIVSYKAEKGEAALKNMISLDEGAKYLGEVALVPYNSPISNLKTIFYNTLYDENASCHFAIGRAYKYTLEGGIHMNDEEFLNAGGNVSNTHVDFMVGSKDLSIVGITADGEEVQIFKNGDWAF